MLTAAGVDHRWPAATRLSLARPSWTAVGSDKTKGKMVMSTDALSIVVDSANVGYVDKPRYKTMRRRQPS